MHLFDLQLMICEKKVKSVLLTFRHFNNVVYQGDENS